MTYTYYCVYNTELLMTDRGTVRNVLSSILKKNLRNQCILLVLLKEYIMMHGPLNVKRQMTICQNHCNSNMVTHTTRKSKFLTNVLTFSDVPLPIPNVRCRSCYPQLIQVKGACICYICNNVHRPEAIVTLQTFHGRDIHSEYVQYQGIQCMVF